MIITGKHLSRRTMLKGVGATVALPFLEAMVPARTAYAQSAAAAAKVRFAAIEMVHGSAGATVVGTAEAHVVAGGDRARLRPGTDQPARRSSRSAST